MSKIVYEVVNHDGGYAYRVGETLSETFSSHDGARIAAVKAAAEHELRGRPEEIELEEGKGNWHQEHASGSNRPTTSVSDRATDK